MNIQEIQLQLDSNRQVAVSLQTEIGQIGTDLSRLQEQVRAVQLRIDNFLGDKPTSTEVEPNPEVSHSEPKALWQYVHTVLENAIEPLTIGQIADLVREAGCPTKSKNLSTMVITVLKKKEELRSVVRRSRTRPYQYNLR